MTDQHDDRFEHPERWTYSGLPVLHIWPHPDGLRVSVTYIGGDGQVYAERALLDSTYVILRYTPPPPPDPWEGHVPEWVEFGTTADRHVILRDHHSPVAKEFLPPRRFRLVPIMEGEQ